MMGSICRAHSIPAPGQIQGFLFLYYISMYIKRKLRKFSNQRYILFLFGKNFPSIFPDIYDGQYIKKEMGEKERESDALFYS